MNKTLQNVFQMSTVTCKQFLCTDPYIWNKHCIYTTKCPTTLALSNEEHMEWNKFCSSVCCY